MKVERKIANRRLAVFCRSYNLRSDVTLEVGDEFLIGKGPGEYPLDEEGNLVIFMGEFWPHRIHPDNFDIVDEMTITTVKVHRKKVGGAKNCVGGDI